MASVERQVRNGQLRWQARWRDDSGRQKKKTFDRKIDAERFLTTVEHGILIGSYVDPAAGRRTFGHYARQWQAVQVHRPSTQAQVETHFRRHVLPHLGHRPLAAVRPSEVQSWVRGRAQVLSPATVEVIYRYVAAIFRSAVTDRLIPVSPCVGIKLPKVEPQRVEPLPTDAVLALADAVSARFRALVVLAAGTGLRQGECFGLTVQHVDFLRRHLRVEQQLVLLPGAPPLVAPPKTQASYRTVPLPAVVGDALAEHLARWPADRDGFVFTSAAGQPLRRTRFSEMVWRPAVQRAGLPAGTRFHDLRHYYASCSSGTASR